MCAEVGMVAMDVVEVSPPYDSGNNITALFAHRCVLEALTGTAMRRLGLTATDYLDETSAGGPLPTTEPVWGNVRRRSGLHRRRAPRHGFPHLGRALHRCRRPRVRTRPVFDRAWSIVADGEELALPGSYITATVQNVPLAVVRDRLGTLRAFHNICRHRGIALWTGAVHWVDS